MGDGHNPNRVGLVEIKEVERKTDQRTSTHAPYFEFVGIGTIHDSRRGGFEHEAKAATKAFAFAFLIFGFLAQFRLRSRV